MITGTDSVLVLGGDPAGLVHRFLRSWSASWPAMRVTIGESDTVRFQDWDGTGVLSPGPEEILVARDEAMESHWDEHGYTLDATGEGPFAIYYRPYTRRTTEVLALQVPYDHGGGFSFEPYEMVVVGAGLTLLTVVSPDDADDFTTRIIEGLLRS